MTDKSIFDFTTYKAYLEHRVGGYRERKGQRSLVAKALGCQPTFVTQVLNGDFHFSMEQTEKLNRFFEHSEEEADYLFLLVQKDRAGTRELTQYFGRKIEKIRSDRRILTKRLGKEKLLTEDQQAIYYSSWHYAAIHVAVDIPELKTREKIAEFFRLPLGKVTEILEYLVTSGLVVKEGSKYSIGGARLRLGKESPNIARHYTNWRLQSIDSLDRGDDVNLHYSGVLSMSRAAREKINSAIFDTLKQHLAISDDSNSEELVCYNVDFFSLRR